VPLLASCHGDVRTRNCRWRLSTDINKRRRERKTGSCITWHTVSDTCDIPYREIAELLLEQEMKKHGLDSEY